MKFALACVGLFGPRLPVTGAGLVAGYSMLSADYFVRGMDNITGRHMEQAAQHIWPQHRRSGGNRKRVWGIQWYRRGGGARSYSATGWFGGAEQRNGLIKINSGNGNGAPLIYFAR